MSPSLLWNGTSFQTLADSTKLININSFEINSKKSSEFLDVQTGARQNFTINLHTNQGSLRYIVLLEIFNEDSTIVDLYEQENVRPNQPDSSSTDFNFHWKSIKPGIFKAKAFVIANLDSSALTWDMSESQLTVKELKAKSPQRANEIQILPGLPAAKYTVLIYMVASGLESEGYHATEDLNEMTNVGSTPNVKVIVETGGAANATLDDHRSIDFTKVQRHLILKDKIETLQDMGKQNMGSSETLYRFVDWGINEYPADKYAIILWDHGAGVAGFGRDNIFNDSLTLDEIRDGLEPARFLSDKIEIIGFDACLMASIEVAKQISPTGNYLVASQELEPEWGWDYSAILSSLQKIPTQAGKELAKVIADSYAVHIKEKAMQYHNFNSEKAITMSVIDLKKIARVAQTVDNIGDFFDSRLADQETTYGLTSTIRLTERYGEGGRESSGHIDLYNFGDNLKGRFPGLSGLVDDLKSGIDEAVVYHVSGEAKPDSHGISIFMPVQKYEANAAYSRYIIGSWVKVFEYDRRVLDGDVSAPEISFNMNQDANNTIIGRIKGSDVSTVDLWITEPDKANKLLLRIPSIVHMDFSDFAKDTDKYGLISFVWDKKIMSLCNPGERDCQPSDIWFEKDGKMKFAFMPVRLESGRFNGTLILIYIVEDERTFSFIGGWPGIDEQGNARRELLPLIPGDKIYTSFLQFEYFPNSGKSSTDSVERESPILVSDGFGPMYHQYTGEYDIMISACDFSNNCSYSNEFHFSIN